MPNSVWLDETLNWLTAQPVWPYYPGQTSATEPTALVALALLGHHRAAPAARAIRWLLDQQGEDGSLGTTTSHSDPRWPTALAIVAWEAARRQRDSLPLEPAHLEAAIARGQQALLRIEGTTLDRTPELGHDSTLVGWPWAEGTHAWSEPTALAVLALKSIGQGASPRVREGVALIADRLLPDGGCNYGNTTVLGQTLRPHVEPTGWALMALAHEGNAEGRVEKSLAYLEREAPHQQAAVSLSVALLGLSAHGIELSSEQCEPWLRRAAERVLARRRSCWKLALLSLAALGSACPLITLPRGHDR